MSTIVTTADQQPSSALMYGAIAGTVGGFGGYFLSKHLTNKVHTVAITIITTCGFAGIGGYFGYNDI